MHLAKIKFVEAILCLPEFLHTFGETQRGFGFRLALQPNPPEADPPCIVAGADQPEAEAESPAWPE